MLFLGEQQPEFRRPVRQRSAQPLQARMPAADLGFDLRDLLVATGDSYWCLLAFLGDLVERAPVAVESRLST